MKKMIYRIMPVFNKKGDKSLEIKMKIFGINMWKTVVVTNNADRLQREIEGLKSLFIEQELER